MGGEGSMQHMRNVLKSNKALLNKRSTIFERGSKFSRVKKEYLRATNKDFYYKKTSKAELIEIRKRILKERKYNRLKSFVIVLFMIPVVGFCVYMVNQSIKAGNRQAIELQEARDQVENEAINLTERRKYADCIADGDKWLKRNHWHNAIFQYKIALELYPSDLGVKTRLAMAYTYRCREEGESCAEAKKYIDHLLEYQPDNKKLYELLASYYFGIEDSTSATVALNKAVNLGRTN